MMKLFEKYLLACTNQRIPMPREWQTSLGLSLSSTKQQEISTPSEITGYKFQRDDEMLQRGFVHRQVRSLELDEEARYLIGLYLQALKEHQRTDFRHYFPLQTTSYEFPYYTSRASVSRTEKYSVYGDSMRPSTLRILLKNRVVYERFIDTLATIKPYVVDIQEILNTEEAIAAITVLNAQDYREKDYALPLTPVVGDVVVDDTPVVLSDEPPELPNYLQAFDEYLVLEIESFVQTVILPGVYNDIFSYMTYLSNPQATPPLLPSAGYRQTAYSDKLIPTLLDINITVNSPKEEKSLLGGDYPGSTIEEKIRNNTKGIYDVDSYIGRNFPW